jgi:hypothetical protein
MNDLRTSKRNPAVAVALIVTAVGAAAALVALRLHFQPPVVPLYALAADDAGPEERVVPNAPFAVTLTPTAPLEGAVALRGFLLRDDEVRPWDPPFVVNRDGTFHVVGRTEVLFAGVPDGAWDMAFAVGRPEVLPTAPRDVLRAREHDPAERGWHLVRRRISVTGMGGEPTPRTP